MFGCLADRGIQSACSAADCVMCGWMISPAHIGASWQAYLICIWKTVQRSRDRCNLFGFLGSLSRLQLHLQHSGFFSHQIRHALIPLSDAACAVSEFASADLIRLVFVFEKKWHKFFIISCKVHAFSLCALHINQSLLSRFFCSCSNFIFINNSSNISSHMFTILCQKD